MNKIKVAWICEISNSVIRKNLEFYRWTPIALIRRLFNKMHACDLHIWNSNGINELEKYEDIELHVISPHDYLSSVQEFTINNVHYHFINKVDDCFTDMVYRNIFKKIRTDYSRNAKKICNIIERINPDLVHMIGAEIPSFSQSAEFLSHERPLIVTLQTLLSDPIFLKNRPWFLDKEAYRVEIETKVLKRADYIGTKAEHFRSLIREKINGDAKFLDMNLALEEDICLSDSEKMFDFVYFAKDISKAVDWAIEAFALAAVEHPQITLHVVGGYTGGVIETIKARIKELGILSQVDFTGKLPTHDDVIEEIGKARFALLPVKADLVSCTIREAMAHGLPVVTNITPLTPKLNETRESLLLSEKGDFEGMAKSMCRLLTEKGLAETLRTNAVKTINERYSNAVAMREWVDIYRTIASNSSKAAPIQ